MSRRRTRAVIGICAVVTVVALLLGACGGSPAAPSPTVAPAQPAAKPAAQPAASAHSAAKPITLVFSEFEAPGSFWDTKIAKPYFAEIDKRTNGRVKIEAHFGGELASLFEVYEAVSKGTVDMAKILPTMDASKFPVDGMGIFNPVNAKTYRPNRAWLDFYNEFPEAKTQYKYSPLLGYAIMPCSGLATVKNKTITKWEDAKGLKAPGAGPAAESRLKAIGIVPVSINPPDIYMAAKNGMLDVVAVGLISLRDFKWGEVLPNVTLVNINNSPWSYVMSAKAWNSLPPDIQQVFIDLVPWLTDLSDRVQYENEQTALKEFGKEFGTNFIKLSQAELDRWAVVDGPTLDAYIKENITAKGMPGDKMKSEFLRLYQKYGAEEYAFK